MARYTTTQPTTWDAATAFDWMSDLTHLAVWDPSIPTSEQVVGDGPGVGSEYDVTVDVAGGARTMRYVVRELDPVAHTMLAVSETPVLTSYDRISVVASGAGAEVTYDADLVMKGPAKLADPVVAKGFDRMGDKAADGLRATLAGPPPA